MATEDYSDDLYVNRTPPLSKVVLDQRHPELGGKTADFFEECWQQLDDFSTENPAFASDHVLEASQFINTGSRMELPMIVHNGTRVATRPDSGSEENIILADLVDTLGLNMDSSPECQREFRIANGKVVKAAGRVTIECSFENDPLIKMQCIFYVFAQLISPIIMGMAFLDRTETLHKYRFRLRPRSNSPKTRFELCSVDSPMRQLYCLADGEPQLANADTGSEIDLVSRSYVERRDLDVNAIELTNSEVQFADGSITQLFGKYLSRLISVETTILHT